MSSPESSKSIILGMVKARERTIEGRAILMAAEATVRNDCFGAEGRESELNLSVPNLQVNGENGH